MRRGGWGAAAVGCGPVAVGCVARPGWGCPCASGGKRQSSCAWTRVRFVSWCTVGCRGGGGETPACRWRLINSPAWAGGGGAVRPCAPSRRAVMPCLSPTAGLSRGAPQAEPRPGGGGHRSHPTCGGHRRAHHRRDRRHGRRCRHRSRRGAVGGNAPGPPERGSTAAATAARAADFITQTKTQVQRRRRSQRQAAGNRLGRRAPLGSPARQAAARRQPPRPRRHAKPAAVSVLPCFVGVRLGCALPTFGTPASPPQEPLVSSNLRLWSIPIIGRRHGHRRQQLRQRPQQHRCILARVSSATICSICVGRANRNDSRRQRGATRGYVPRRGGRHADRGRHTGGVVGGSNAHGRSGRRVAYDRPRPPPPAAAIAGGRERG